MKYFFLLMIFIAFLADAMESPKKWDLDAIADDMAQVRRKKDKKLISEVEKICQKKDKQLCNDEVEILRKLSKSPKYTAILKSFCSSSLFKDADSDLLKSLIMYDAVHGNVPQNVELLFSHGICDSYKNNPSVYGSMYYSVLNNILSVPQRKSKIIGLFLLYDKSPVFLKEILAHVKIVSDRQLSNICFFHGIPISPLKSAAKANKSLDDTFLLHAHARRVHRLAQYLTRCVGWPVTTPYPLVKWWGYRVAEYRFGKLSPEDWKLIATYPVDDYKKVRTP